MDTGARSTTREVGTMERRMSMEETDAFLEHCWKRAQERQKLDPSGGKRKTAEGLTLGRFKPYSETKADVERLYQESVRMRAELEAEMAACSISAPPPPPPPPPMTSVPSPPPPPPGRRRLVKKSRG